MKHYRSDKLCEISRRKTATTLLREIVAPAGLAPYANDSGKASKRRRASARSPSCC
ncbi:MAG: hypothetical protein LE178_05075 [Endomicrobium sp.]|nr:hypothetical protein [Endomicrobium sp.]